MDWAFKNVGLVVYNSAGKEVACQFRPFALRPLTSHGSQSQVSRLTSHALTLLLSHTGHAYPSLIGNINTSTRGSLNKFH